MEMDPDYGDGSQGAMAVCPACLSLISSEGGKISLIDYHSLTVRERCMFISGITMMLTQRAIDQLAGQASGSDKH